MWSNRPTKAKSSNCRSWADCRLSQPSSAKSSKTETVVPKKEHQPLPPPTGAYYRATKPIDKLRAGDLILLWTEEGQIHGQFGDEGFYYDEEEFAGHFIPAPEGRSERLRQIETILTEANAEKNVTPDVLQLPLSVEQGTNPEAALVTTKHRSSIIEAKKAALPAKKRVEVIKTELHGLLMEQQKALELASTKWERPGSVNAPRRNSNLSLQHHQLK